jgi:iron complex transport system permease protein
MTISPNCGTEALPSPTCGRGLARLRFGGSAGVPLLALILLGCMLGSLCIGAYPVPLTDVTKILLSLSLPEPLRPVVRWSDAEFAAIQVIRLPRILLAVLAGGGLGISGAALQGMMRNPLVGPDLIGISSGAACGGILAILFDWPSWGLLAAAFSGGFLALASAWTLARLSRGGGVLPFILAGVVVAAFFTAMHGLIQYTADPENKLPTMVYWLIGSFAGATPHKVAILAPPVLVAGGGLLLLRWRINLLSLGDLDAAALGVRGTRLRWIIIALVSLIVAAQVAVSGIVGWVGLIVPHFARMMVGPDHRRLLPAAALIGAIFLLAMDDIARTLVQQELPIGILTAGLGTPVFALLFWRMQAKGWSHE